MKFWELTTVASGAPYESMMKGMALSVPEWHHLADWIDNLSVLATKQDRSKLDAEIPDAYVREVLARLPITLFLTDRNLRSSPLSSTDKPLEILEAFDLFGGQAIEETLEKGSWPIGGFE